LRQKEAEALQGKNMKAPEPVTASSNEIKPTKKPKKKPKSAPSIVGKVKACSGGISKPGLDCEFILYFASFSTTWILC
jgi:hypothetical protein